MVSGKLWHSGHATEASIKKLACSLCGQPAEYLIERDRGRCNRCLRSQYHHLDDKQFASFLEGQQTTLEQGRRAGKRERVKKEQGVGKAAQMQRKGLL